MEEMTHNPILEQENYFAGYNKSIEELKNRPELIEFDKLCHAVFNTPDGKKFIEVVTERFIIPSLVNNESGNYQLKLMWADGFKDFPRMIMNHIRSHEQRIQAEVNKAGVKK